VGHAVYLMLPYHWCGYSYSNFLPSLMVLCVEQWVDWGMATLTAADPKLPLLGTPDCLAPEVRTFTRSSEKYKSRYILFSVSMIIRFAHQLRFQMVR
jgi:hypothetical protein